MAEAKERVAQGETLYLDRELEKVANEIQGNHLEADAWEEDVLRYVEGKTEVTTKEVWELAVQGDRPISKVDQNRISKILRVSGWKYTDVRKDGMRFKAWIR